MSREYLPCPPQMRNGGPPPAHLSSSTAYALGESRWLYPPQRAPDALGQSILDFLAQCRQIETDGREALVAHHEECSRYWAEKMRNGGSPPAHLSSFSAFALGESRWLYPPQRAPDALRPPILGFLTQCEQIENTSREKMRNGGTPPAHLDKAERVRPSTMSGSA